MNTWDMVKTVAGAFIIVYAIQGGLEMAKEQGRKKALEELKNATPHVKNGNPGDAVRVCIDGKEFYIKFEAVENN